MSNLSKIGGIIELVEEMDCLIQQLNASKEKATDYSVSFQKHDVDWMIETVNNAKKFIMEVSIE